MLHNESGNASIVLLRDLMRVLCFDKKKVGGIDPRRRKAPLVYVIFPHSVYMYLAEVT